MWLSLQLAIKSHKDIALSSRWCQALGHIQNMCLVNIQGTNEAFPHWQANSVDGRGEWSLCVLEESGGTSPTGTWLGVLISSFLGCNDKLPNKSYLGKEGLVLAQNSRIEFIMVAGA